MKNAEHHEGRSVSIWRAVSLLFLLAALVGPSSPVHGRRATSPDSKRKAEKYTFWHNFIDRNGQLISTRDFDEVWPFENGLAAVKLGDFWGYIGKTGEFAVEPKFEAVSRFFPATDPAPVKTGGKWGYIDRAGTFIIEPKFDEAFEFAEGLAAVRVGERWGCVDSDGRIAFYVRDVSGEGVKDVAKKVESTLTFIGLGAFKEGMAIAKYRLTARDLKTGETGGMELLDYVTRDGRFIPYMLVYATNFDRGLAVVKFLAERDKTKYWVVRKNDLISVATAASAKEIHIERIEYVGEGYYIVIRPQDLAENLMDREGNFVSNEWFTSVLPVSDGLAGVSRGPYGGPYKYGYIDLSGKLVIPLQDFEERPGYFKEGLVACKNLGKWGYIDKTGRWAIEPRWAQAEQFSEGLAVVRPAIDQPEESWALIDKSGQVVGNFPSGYWPYNVWGGMRFSEGLMAVKRREAVKKNR